ncbi:MAG: hypothetical protein ACRDRH_01035 [Pseudonocardia sp.]
MPHVAEIEDRDGYDTSLHTGSPSSRLDPRWRRRWFRSGEGTREVVRDPVG